MDFVTFEMAMKLKEKGFREPCIYAYCKSGGWNMYRGIHEPITYILRTDGNPFGSYYGGENWNKKFETNKNKIQCSAPTINEVLKWLRSKKLIIVINPEYFDVNGYCVDWSYDIWADDNYEHSFETYNTYESATLAAIEHCLNNLI